MIGFTQYNRRTKKFKSRATNFEYADKIPTNPEATVIYHGANGNNIHPTTWKAVWFKEEKKAEKYINKIRDGYK